jgi:glycosyltransferase involved in cell wall biosynthesis
MNFEEFKKKYEKVPVDLYLNQVTEHSLVSVCVQTYQQSAYIKDCLEGILMQKTNFPFEILLGEDQSTDGTREICMEYAQKYPDKIRLFLHHRENNIKINGRQTGLFNFLYNFFNSRGKYIAICEGDDYWTDPLKLQNQVNEMETNLDINICSHPVVIMNDKLKKEASIWCNFGNAKRILPVKDVILNYGSVCPTAAILIRNVNVPFFVDLVLDAQAAHGVLTLLWSHPSGVLYLPEPMAVYRVAASTSTVSNYLKKKAYHFIYMNGKNKTLLEINNYFKGLYSKEIDHKIKMNQHSLVVSNKVSLKNKLHLINNNKHNFSLYLIIVLFLKSMVMFVVKERGYHRIKSIFKNKVYQQRDLTDKSILKN